MRFGFFFREAVRALKRNAVPSFAAMATVLVTVLILGVFIPMVQATTGAANEVRGKVIADVYMKTNAEQADIDRVQKLIETQVPHVGKVQFVSKKQALAAEREAGRGDYYDLLGSNPLPDTFRITPDNPDNIGHIRGAAAGGLLLGLGEEMMTGYGSSTYRDAIAFVVLIFVLLVRPAGLFGKYEVEKV